MQNFKLGDKVQYKKDYMPGEKYGHRASCGNSRDDQERSNFSHMEITVIDPYEDGNTNRVYVKTVMKDGKVRHSSCCSISIEQLELIGSARSPMAKLKLIARKLLDKDTATLVEAGILNDDLTIRDQDFVLSFVVNANKELLAKEAKFLLDEEKSSK